MKRVSTLLIYICLNIYLTGCGAGGGGTEAQTAPVDPSQPSIIGPTPPGNGGGGSTPTTVSGTYYTLVKTATVSQGGNSYPVTFTGHCASYNSLDYCWDDGWQTVPAINYSQSFWQICKLGGVVGQCHGGGSTDPVITPTKWTEMAAVLTTPPFQPSDVYTQGIATPVTCTISGSTVDCVDFQIDINQAPL